MWQSLGYQKFICVLSSSLVYHVNFNSSEGNLNAKHRLSNGVFDCNSNADKVCYIDFYNLYNNEFRKRVGTYRWDFKTYKKRRKYQQHDIKQKQREYRQVDNH